MAIKGFEKETAPLTPEERLMVPYIKRTFIEQGGKPIRSQSIATILQRNNVAKPNLSGARIRKMINHLRIMDKSICILATSKGYWISNDKKEISDYIESLNQRIGAQQAVRDAIVEYKEINLSQTLF